MTSTLNLPERLLSDVVALRRDLHMHPELGFEEHRTAGIVADRLKKLGFDVHTGIAGTGVVGVMRGALPGRTIMLRADMDALPIREENAHAYRSITDGKMHACGHDGHVAMLLGAAELIAEGKDRLPGTVCLLFQPAEEGHGGAKVMVEEGVIERFGIERAFGLHLNTKLPVGTLGFREGPFYASSDSIEIDVLGKGGHGSAPHDAVDPIYTAANFITSVQQVVSRHVDPIEPAVVTIASIHGGTIHNVIPRTVRMLGTVRAFSDDVRSAMPGRIERVLKSCCEAMGANYEFTYLWRYPVTSNDPEQTRYARALAERTAGEEQIVTADKLMGAEDFSFFAQRVPACFYSLGARGGPESSHPHHSSTFDIDERALPLGVRMMAALAFDAPKNAP
ncbi:MAG TPA: M20 family metallopeptidase [Candidatus Baltobacteraceae bacterium]|nr:M20 family metallopeptidase [Candidatus Baltobacteraceae bacterium]